MAINKINTTAEEQNFKFLTNQSSIIRTYNTNNITTHGINVIVSKPNKGDIMCVTRYKNGDTLLNAEEQKVVWIDGLSIVPEQLSTEFEPVGICVAINGNKAIVKYRKGKNHKWASANSSLLTDTINTLFDSVSHTLTVTLNGTEYEFTFTTNSYEDFNAKLNNFFKEKNKEYSSILVNNQIVINCTSFNKPTITNKASGVNYTLTGKTAADVNSNQLCYRNNGFYCEYTKCYAGCCRARYYEFVYYYRPIADGKMTNINYVPYAYSEEDIQGFLWPTYAVDFNDFYGNYGNDYCEILRKNFATYDEYFDSMMAKYPSGKGDVMSEFPSGKENTYKLVDYTFIDNVNANESYLYPALNYAASIDVKVPKLGKGNWWLPSVAEMLQMMHDVTYDTSFWDSDNVDNNTDIVNRVLFKLNSFDSEKWDMLSALTDMWASSKYSANNAYFYYGVDGNIGFMQMNYSLLSTPITVYEF